MLHKFPPPPWPDRIVCEVCGHKVAPNVPGFDPAKVTPECGDGPKPEPPCEGECPGEEYMILTNTLGLRASLGCDCPKIKADMDRLKIEGCLAQREELIARLQKNYAAHFSYQDLFAAARRAKKREAFKLLWKLRTLDANTAIERLFDLAVEKAVNDRPAS
jgi:hypothetical protein